MRRTKKAKKTLSLQVNLRWRAKIDLQKSTIMADLTETSVFLNAAAGTVAVQYTQITTGLCKA